MLTGRPGGISFCTQQRWHFSVIFKYLFLWKIKLFPNPEAIHFLLDLSPTLLKSTSREELILSVDWLIKSFEVAFISLPKQFFWPKKSVCWLWTKRCFAHKVVETYSYRHKVHNDTEEISGLWSLKSVDVTTVLNTQVTAVTLCFIFFDFILKPMLDGKDAKKPGILLIRWLCGTDIKHGRSELSASLLFLQFPNVWMILSQTPLNFIYPKVFPFKQVKVRDSIP